MNRTVRLVPVALLGVAFLAVALTGTDSSKFADLPVNDFVEYWAAGSLNLSGQNPYDPQLMLERERSAGYAADDALMMFNPPPVLTLVMPFGALPYQTAALLWLVLQATALVWSCFILWEVAGGEARLRWVAFACGLAFLPTIIALMLGQISILILLGLALFLRFEREGKMVAAGASLTLLLIKPHIVYLVGVALVVLWLRSRNRRIVLGVVLGGIGLLVPLAFNPSVYAQHLELSRSASLSHFTTSTLGQMLRLATGDPSKFGFQFVPMILGLAYLATRLRRTRHADWDWNREMPLLVVMSVATAAYGWLFDQVVLLVAAIPMFVSAIQAGGIRLLAMIGFWTIIGGVCFVQAFQGVNAMWYFWIPFAFLAAASVSSPGFRHRRRPSAEQPESAA